MRVTIGEQIIEIINGTGQNARQNGKHHLRSHEPPEIGGKGLMKADTVYAVNNESADDADAHRQERHDDSYGDIPEDNCRSRLPHKVEDGRHVLQSAQPIAPGSSLSGLLLWLIG